MEQYIIKGGMPLCGDVSIGGAKNAALGILAAAIMADETVTIENVPNVRDTRALLQTFEGIGAKVKYVYNNSVQINGQSINDVIVDNDSIKKIRASYYLLGALLGKYRRAEVALPGGCNIGSRPIDQHIKGFRALGANVEIKGGMVIAEAKELKGSHIYLDVVSVGATINIMLAACMAEGNTIIENSAKEPHIVDVANFLNSMGANIKGAGTDVIRIKGVKHLSGTTYSIIPDQIEAGTFMFAAAATKGDVTIRNVIPKHLEFPTDMQPQMAVVLALANGSSMVTESIFENRFKYVDELTRMGARIKVEGNTAYIEGVPGLTGAQVASPDLRAGAALVIAALAADGISIIDDIQYIQRGYEDFEIKLRSLGALIEKVDSDREIQKFKLRVG